MRITPDKDHRIGCAFDLGTTTIVGASVNLADLSVIRTVSLPNPQARWGRDVVSRINAVCREPGVLKELSRSVIGACNSIMRDIAPGDDIKEITVAGNPVMEHLLLDISPEPLSRVPYRPAFTEARRVKAGELGLDAGPDTLLYTFPLIGGFVGGDAVAVMLSLGMDKEASPCLAIDIGTNSEIMLSSSGTIYATSTAAGPAFEGGEIRFGMIAEKGAIQGVRIEGDNVILDCIGKVAPKGICGSGLIEAAAALIRAGVIDGTGRIRNRGEIPDNLANRIKEEEGGNSFILYRGAGGAITLSQADIRALQTAKSATKAGILMLLKKASLKPGDLGKVYIAGAFGSHLKADALTAIGLIEKEWLKDISSVGDAALSGAILALSEEKKKEAEELAGKVKYVSLSGSAHFEREFIRNMNFY